MNTMSRDSAQDKLAHWPTDDMRPLEKTKVPKLLSVLYIKNNCYCQGVCYLYIKTVERSHSPAKMWEKVKLSKNYPTALKQVGQGILILYGYPAIKLHLR